jgi:Zn-dependent peptidase ImmA (M78 family)
MARRLTRPRQLGRDLLVDIGARAPEHIDPIETAKERGIEVTFGNLTGATARIYRVRGKARIRVSEDIVTEGRRRMSIMHEVGHEVLGHELPTEGDAASWFRTSCDHRDKREERDADILSIEHLTPAPMVRPYCEVAHVDLNAVATIERVFRASRVMAAMRFVELSPHACAVVYSERGCVKWMKPSKTFPRYIAKGTALGSGSIAFDYFASGAISGDLRTYAASVWLGNASRVAPGTAIIEHAVVIPEPGWGGVLSLLWIPHLVLVSN